MTQKKPGYFRQLFEALAPKENRLIAGVSFVRTFRQGFTGSAIVAAGGGVALTAAGLAQINWTTLGLALGAVALSALGSAATAGSDVLQHGLASKYAKAVVDQITATGTAPSTEIAAAVTDAAAAIKDAA